MQIVGYREEYAEKLSEIVVRNLLEVNARDYPIHKMRQIILNFGPEQIRNFAAKREVFVAIEGDEPVGILTVAPSWSGKKGEYYFLTIFVQPEYHRKGIGQALIAAGEEYVRACGGGKITIPASITAHAFYHKMGYSYTSQQPDSEGHYIMEKYVGQAGEAASATSRMKMGPICDGAPKEQRSEREMRVYAALQRLNIPFARLDHPAVYSAADGSCDAIDAALGIPNLKNLFLRNADKTRYFMVTLPAEKRADLKKLAGQLGVSRLSFGRPEQMEAFLDLQPGSVSVLGLMNDADGRVQLVLDHEIRSQEVLGCHPCVNTSSLRISMQDFLEVFLPAFDHAPIWMDV